MKTNFFAIFQCVFLFTSLGLLAQNDTLKTDSTKTPELIEKLTYKQQPGLAMAASKIFFSKKRYSISGFGEVNFVSYLGEKNTSTGDLELYYTNLYRSATFFGYRFNNKLLWNSEFQIEFLHDGNRESHYEIIIEAFIDWLATDALKMRAGFFPLMMGFVNNNDEPVMFYSVNRSEVERIIMPSSWIELGWMAYGNISSKFSYALSLSQGLQGKNFIGSTWIRQGRDIFVKVPTSISFNPQIKYNSDKGFTSALSAYIGQTGQGETFDDNGVNKTLKAPVQLYTLYTRYEKHRFSLMALGAYGQLADTYDIFRLTQQQTQTGQVLGSSTYGLLFEAGYDILPWLRKSKGEVEENNDKKENFFYKKKEMKLPVFARYERLNTHNTKDFRLIGNPTTINDLDVVTFGINFNTRENIVFKANYQWRNNRYNPLQTKEPDFIELGFGYIF
jgi:hypothetical protein